MSNSFDSIQNMGKDNVDLAMKSVGAVTKGLQAIATETADYGKRSFEASAAAFEKLASAKSVDVATAVQSEFVRSAYGGDTLHRRLKTDLSQSSIEALADFTGFLFDRGFLPNAVDVGAWIDRRPFEALGEAEARHAA